MAIEDIKRLPASYDTTSKVVNRDLKNVAGTETSAKVTESANQASNKPINSTKPVAEDVKKAAPDAGEVNAAISKLQDYVQKLDRELQFTVDKDTGRTIVKILDGQTQEVVRQIPSEELLELTKSLEHTQGILFKTQA